LLVPLLFAACSDPLNDTSDRGNEYNPGGYDPNTGGEVSRYTVTFKRNYDPDYTLYTKTVTTPATTIAPGEFPANPSRSGYTFAGWNTQADGSGDGFTASTTVSATITVYAQWTPIPPNSYTVTFKVNDGTETNWAAKTVTAPATMVTEFPASPARSGYGFGSWNTQADGSGGWFTASTAVSGDITVYAIWAEGYAVTFMMNNGTEAVHAVKAVAPSAGALAAGAFPDNPHRFFYTFAGWNTAADGSGDGFVAWTTVSGTMTVYALWVDRPSGSYEVEFRMDDSWTGPLWAAKTVIPPATTVDALPVPPSRAGYNFGGWEEDYWKTEFTAATAVTGFTRVYARWDPLSYTVTFDKDGGNTAAYPATKTVTTPATTVDALPVPPSQVGYNFGGWYTEHNGGGSEFIAATAVTGSMTVYARWDSYSYTVTFNNNGGTTTASPAVMTVTSPDTTIGSLPTPPTRTNYNFVNWNTQANGSGTVFTESTTVHGDIKVYAQWAHTEFNITLNPDVGDGAFSQDDFTVSKSGNPNSQTITITGLDYTDPRWLVDGALRGTGGSITLYAADYGAGDHNLTLLIRKNDTTWSKDIAFIVIN
jgi:uncharacterized repeat protein (TIGR02543 family)